MIYGICDNFSRKLQIPDGSAHIRPQPRKPDFLRAPAHGRPAQQPVTGTSLRSCEPTHEGTAYSDIIPRTSVPLPPSPPVLHHPSVRREVDNASFTFPPSTCSEDSGQRSPDSVQRLPPQPNSNQRDGNTAMKMSKHGHMSQETRTTPEFHIQEPQLLLPPSAFELPQAGTVHPSRDEDPILRPRMTVSSGPLVDIITPGASAPPAMDLSNPAMRLEIVHMRDELKQFHDLKARQR